MSAPAGRHPRRVFRFRQLIRDPYVLEFVGLAEQPRYTETDLETALLDHLQSFLLELGSGFWFEARSRRLRASARRLFDCHALGEVARLIDIRALENGNVIRQQL